MKNHYPGLYEINEECDKYFTVVSKQTFLIHELQIKISSDIHTF